MITLPKKFTIKPKKKTKQIGPKTPLNRPTRTRYTKKQSSRNWHAAGGKEAGVYTGGGGHDPKTFENKILIFIYFLYFSVNFDYYTIILLKLTP